MAIPLLSAAALQIRASWQGMSAFYSLSMASMILGSLSSAKDVGNGPTDCMMHVVCLSA